MMRIRGGSIADELGIYGRGASKGVRKRLSLQLKAEFAALRKRKALLQEPESLPLR